MCQNILRFPLVLIIRCCVVTWSVLLKSSCLDLFSNFANFLKGRVSFSWWWPSLVRGWVCFFYNTQVQLLAFLFSIIHAHPSLSSSLPLRITFSPLVFHSLCFPLWLTSLPLMESHHSVGPMRFSSLFWLLLSSFVSLHFFHIVIILPYLR